VYWAGEFHMLQMFQYTLSSLVYDTFGWFDWLTSSSGLISLTMILLKTSRSKCSNVVVVHHRHIRGVMHPVWTDYRCFKDDNEVYYYGLLSLILNNDWLSIFHIYATYCCLAGLVLMPPQK
jgi:hypothetical protein